MSIGRQGGPKKAARTRFRKIARKLKAAQLYKAGKTQVEVARVLGVDQKTVSHDVNEMAEEWREQQRGLIAQLKRKELEKLDELEKEHRAAWERSRQDVRVTRREQEQVPDPQNPGQFKPSGHARAVLVSTEQTGDPRYLTGILAVMDRRAKLLGLDAPTKHANTDGEGNDLPVARNALLISIRSNGQPHDE